MTLKRIPEILCIVVLLNVFQTKIASGETLQIDFGDYNHSWAFGFADYPPDENVDWTLLSGTGPLPSELSLGKAGAFLSGNNRSDDMFMFLKRRFQGFDPGQTYSLRFSLSIGSNADTCVGVGGSSGKGVFLKAGASEVEPVAEASESGWLRMNIDKGNQAQGGRNSIVVGDIAVTDVCSNNIYKYKYFKNNNKLIVTADRSGAFWIFFGTDSGFEGITTIYYINAKINIKKM